MSCEKCSGRKRLINGQRCECWTWQVPAEMITTLDDLEHGNALIRLRNTVHALALAGALAEAKRRGAEEARNIPAHIYRAGAIMAALGEPE